MTHAELSRYISIHALREEGDVVEALGGVEHGISIHALREEGDATPAPWTACGIYFYPRPPRGGRQDQNDL